MGSSSNALRQVPQLGDALRSADPESHHHDHVHRRHHQGEQRDAEDRSKHGNRLPSTPVTKITHSMQNSTSRRRLRASGGSIGPHVVSGSPWAARADPEHRA